MANSIFIITGTSRGIGEALAKTLLKDGHEVYGISRGASSDLSQYKNYTHIHYDLSNTAGIVRLVRNDRSNKAIERIGAMKEGILRQDRILHDGFIRNANIYSIISSEWPDVKNKLKEFLQN